MYAAFLFLSLVLMFASYVVLSDKIINHHQISRGFVLMYSHIAIVLSVLLMTVYALYLNNKNVDRKFLYELIIGTVALYYFSLIANQVYSKKVCQFKKIEAITLLTIFIIGALILWLVKNSNFVGYDLLINMEFCLFLSFSNEKQKFFKLTLL